MATKLVISPDGARAVYDDKWVSILEALGSVSIERSTEVEYNADASQWEARYRPTGEVIAAGRMRAAVIKSEVEYLEREVIR